MAHFYVLAAVAVVSLILGVVFAPGLSRFAVAVFTDVKKEYAKALEEAKALYDADTQKLRADVDRISKMYDDDVAKLKSDWAAEVLKLKAELGEANNKVSVLTSVIKGATIQKPDPPPHGIAVILPPTAPATTPTRTKAEIAADLATAQAKEAQLQADLAAATE